MQVDHRKGPRRRGDVLEAAILRAAIEELADVGYTALSMERVAARARTSKAALYRRWGSRAELMVDAYTRFMLVDVTTPDTGSLRSDVLTLMRQLAERMDSPMAQMLHGLIADAYGDQEFLRVVHEHLVRVRPAIMQEIIDRAAARGELRARPLTPRQINLPIDLLRAEYLSSGPPVTEEAMAAILDEVFLPLVCHRCG